MSKTPTGFAEHAMEQRRRWLTLTPEQRLAWLEGAKRFARLATHAGPPRPKSATPDPSSSE